MIYDAQHFNAQNPLLFPLPSFLFMFVRKIQNMRTPFYALCSVLNDNECLPPTSSPDILVTFEEPRTAAASVEGSHLPTHRQDSDCHETGQCKHVVDTSKDADAPEVAGVGADDGARDGRSCQRPDGDDGVACRVVPVCRRAAISYLFISTW